MIDFIPQLVLKESLKHIQPLDYCAKKLNEYYPAVYSRAGKKLSKWFGAQESAPNYNAIRNEFSLRAFLCK